MLAQDGDYGVVEDGAAAVGGGAQSELSGFGEEGPVLVDGQKLDFVVVA